MASLGLQRPRGLRHRAARQQWHLSPFVSADYAKVEVDGYSEKSNRSTALTFDDQTRDSKRLGLGLQGKYQHHPANPGVWRIRS